jgi:hypothetical protein
MEEHVRAAARKCAARLYHPPRQSVVGNRRRRDSTAGIARMKATVLFDSRIITKMRQVVSVPPDESFATPTIYPRSSCAIAEGAANVATTRPAHTKNLKLSRIRRLMVPPRRFPDCGPDVIVEPSPDRDEYGGRRIGGLSQVVATGGWHAGAARRDGAAPAVEDRRARTSGGLRDRRRRRHAREVRGVA